MEVLGAAIVAFFLIEIVISSWIASTSGGTRGAHTWGHGLMQVKGAAFCNVVVALSVVQPMQRVTTLTCRATCGV